jgi:hypothetical protein
MSTCKTCGTPQYRIVFGFFGRKQIQIRYPKTGISFGEGYRPGEYGNWRSLNANEKYEINCRELIITGEKIKHICPPPGDE